MSTVAWDGDGLVIVADQVRELGGTERVLTALLERYPEARLIAGDFDTTNVAPGARNPLLERAELFRLGGRRRHYFLPLYTRRFSRVSLPPGDLYLLFVHAGWSSGVVTPVGVPRLGYIAGPPRFLYGHVRDYLRDYPRLARPFLRATIPLMRRRSARLATRYDRLITHSRSSQEALRRRQALEADVIYPPVRTDFFTPGTGPRRHVLTVGRVVEHKHLHHVVAALSGTETPLVVAGAGTGLDRLRARAGANVRFTGFIEDEELRDLYRRSNVLVCPSVEEFGIVMVEALACGTPVIAPRDGGACEIVQDGKTGLLLDRMTPAAIRDAVARIGELDIDPALCRQSAVRFSQARYTAEIEQLLEAERVSALPGGERLEPEHRLVGQQVARALSGP